MFCFTSRLHLKVTLCSRFLLEKQTVVQMVKNFSASYGTRRFISVLTEPATGHCVEPSPVPTGKQRTLGIYFIFPSCRATKYENYIFNLPVLSVTLLCVHLHLVWMCFNIVSSFQ